jgi:predicted nucleotidyltransferase
MPAVDAPPAALRTVLAVLERHVPDREVRVIGSRVTGAAKPFSDLDLVIMGDTALALRTLAKLRDAFDDSNVPFVVDLVEWAGASDTFRRIISEHSRLLREATPAVPGRTS